MGSEIDRLEVQVEAQATKANNQLDKLVTKLDRVSSALSGLNSGGLAGLSSGVAKFAQASTKLSNVKTADFTRLTKNVEKLSNLNTQQIYGAASSMKTLSAAINSLGGVSANSLQVAEVANSISKLGGANVQRAIANLPALATAMNNFMATMSRAPQVSKNIIDMTNALANLASQGAKVGTAGKSLTTSVNRIGTSMEKTTKKARSFSSVIGSIYQKYFLVMRAGNKLWDSVKSSMDYVEVLNYFDAAFGQVADSAVSQWENAGYDSAEAYYNSFSERAQQLTTKMTGYTITDSGMLESTGGKSLGINPSQLMNYQAMFAQMSNSMGVTAEISLKLSTALTEIGADLASVKNMDFDKVWKDMASGLVGMSRTLDKYGANIRNVNLQQKLTELGINANITALNQNEKALLRTIILLDSTRYAWGDLAETINQPANQLRLLQANFGNLARTIGNIFLPIVAKVLPYINALVIALQRLAEWIVKLLGFEDFDWGSSSGTGGSGFDDLLGSIGDTEDGLNDAAGAAKKLKTQLLGIDELNVLNKDEDTTGNALGGLGGYGGLLEGALDKILDEYQTAWDKAFDEMEARYNQFADNVANAFEENGLYGVGEYFSQELTKALNSIPWETIYEGAKGFGQGLADFLNGLISPELFGAVGKTIASALNTAIYAALSFGENFDFYDYGSSIATGINEFFDTFDFESLADTLNTWIDGLEGAIAGFLNTLKWKDIIDKAGEFLGDLELDTVAVIVGAIVLKKFGAIKIASAALSLVTKPIASAIATKLGIDLGSTTLLAGVVSKLWTALATAVTGAFASMGGMGGLLTMDIGVILGAGTIAEIGLAIGTGLIGGIIAAFAGWNFGQWLNEKITGEEIDMSFFEQMSIIKESFTDGSWKAALDLWGQDIYNGFYSFAIWQENNWNTLWSNVKNFFVQGWNGIVSWWTQSAIVEWWTNSVAPWFTEEKWSGLYQNILTSLETKWGELTKWWSESAVAKWWTDNVQPWFTTEKWNELYSTIKTSLENKWDEVVQWWITSAIYRWYNDNVKPWFSKENWSFSGIKEGLSAAWDGAVKAIKDIWNKFAQWLNEKLTINIDTSSLIGQGISEILGTDKIVLGQLPTFVTGGFPEDGLFMANHSELVGKFSNGRTAVANNEMIVAGIEEAAYRGFARAYSENTREASLLEELIVAVREGKEITIDGRTLVEAYDERKLRNGYGF